MKKSNYGFSKVVNFSFEQALEKVKEALQKEGFGILADIDVKATLKEGIPANIEDMPWIDFLPLANAL